MLIIYVRNGCSLCAKVLRTLGELKISFQEKNIADTAVANELISQGGKLQVPYLVDTEKEIEMYESVDIEAYINSTYGKNQRADNESEAPRVCATYT